MRLVNRIMQLINVINSVFAHRLRPTIFGIILSYKASTLDSCRIPGSPWGAATPHPHAPPNVDLRPSPTPPKALRRRQSIREERHSIN